MSRGPQMICVTATESGTDEDCEAGGRIAKTLIDHYMRRPSVEDRVMGILAKECNKSLYVPGSADPFGCCDMAALLMLEEEVRWLVSGTSRVYHFFDRKLAGGSGDSPYPLLGQRMAYDPILDPPIRLREGDNAFLLASRKLAETVSVSEMERTLADSSDAADWMEKLIQRAGEDTQFCAATVFVKPMAPRSILQKVRRAILGRAASKR